MNENARRFEPAAARRGTRGLAAFLTFLAGMAALAVGLVVAPSGHLDRVPAAWLGIGATAFGIAHMVAVVGLLRRRSWAPSLVGYLAATGIGVASFAALVSVTGLDPFAATSSLPAPRAQADGLGLMVWLIGLWLAATRLSLRSFESAGSPVPGLRSARGLAGA